MLLLKPDFDLVTIRVGDVRERKPRSKLALAKQSATGALNFGDGQGNVLRLLQAKSEVIDSTLIARVVGLPLERKHIEWTGTLNLDLVFVPIVLADAEHEGVELE